MSLAKIQGFRQGLWQGCWGDGCSGPEARFSLPLGLVEFSRRSGRAWAWSGAPLSALRDVWKQSSFWDASQDHMRNPAAQSLDLHSSWGRVGWLLAGQSAAILSRACIEPAQNT